ncbi:uncharacterized protein BXZ73DRAFT_82839 [Epithele typhae]|uniref:uncharacterized protein n=1 Tax=Epithele typhae TaxID=378194 RepID=UPI0020089D4E|nr:uncharacterized protein BXZ73DRAFT_82839 [Epithele typhae]KAH9911364.1 hypothetical protein BXZ73DRAFT_82839 [Epithele typhae]
MASPRVPIEVIEHIIDELGATEHSTAALARCIRVHKSWITRTRIHLWRTLTVSSSEQLPIIRATFDRNPTLRLLVEVVRLKPDRSVEHFARGRPRPFPFTAPIVLLPYLTHIQAWEFLAHGMTPFPLVQATLTSLCQYRDVKRVIIWGVKFKNMFHLYPLMLTALMQPPWVTVPIIPAAATTLLVKNAATLVDIELEGYRLGGLDLTLFQTLESLSVWMQRPVLRDTLASIAHGGIHTSELTIWDTEPGLPVLSEWFKTSDRPDSDLSHCVAFSPDEAQFAHASSTTVHMYSLPLATSSSTSSKIPQRIGHLPLDAKDSHFIGVLWSLDGTQIFVQDAFAQVHVCDALSFAHLRSLLVPSSELAGIQRERLVSGQYPALFTVGDHVLSTLRYTLPDGTLPKTYDFVWDSSTGICRYNSTDIQSSIMIISNKALRIGGTQGEEQLHIISVCKNEIMRTSKVTSTTVEDTPVVTQVFPPLDSPVSLSRRVPESSPFAADGARVLVLPDPGTWSVVDTMTGSTLFRLDHASATDISGMRWSADGRTAIFVPAPIEDKPPVIYWIWNIEEGTTKAVFRWPNNIGRGAHEISADGSMVGFSNDRGDVVFRRVSDLMASALDP